MSKRQLKGITWDHSRGFDPLVACAKEYAKHHNIEVVWEKRSLKDFGDQSIEQLSTRYDLLVIDHPHSGYADKTRCLVPLNTLLAKATLEQLSDQSAGPSYGSYYYRGNQWALPLDAAMQTAAYRPDLLSGPLPSSWHEVLASDKLGLALCPTDSLCSFLSLTAQMGSPIDANNKVLVNNSIGVKALELLRELAARAHPDALNWNPIELLDFMSCETDIAYAPMQFSYTNYSRVGFRNNLLKFANTPRWDNAKFGAVVGGAGIAVSRQCEAPNEAAHYAAWLCSAQIQSGLYTAENGQPANIEAWKNKQANSITQQFFLDTLQTLEDGYIRPRFAAWPAFQEYLGDVVHDYLASQGDASKVISHLNEKYAGLTRQ